MESVENIMKIGFKKRLEALETNKRCQSSPVKGSSIPAAERLIRLVMTEDHEPGMVNTNLPMQFNPDISPAIQLLKMVMPDISSA